MSPGDRARGTPLPHLSFLVLLALAEGDAHGWRIIKRIAAITDGETQPSSGSLYLAMTRMHDRGLLEETAGPDEASDGPARRYYRLTGRGRRVLEAESRRLSTLVTHASRFGLLDRQTAEEAG